MLRQDAADSLRSGRLLRGEVAAASGHHAVHVGLVCVAVRRVHVVVVVIVVIVVVIVVVLQRKKMLTQTYTYFLSRSCLIIVNVVGRVRHGVDHRDDEGQVTEGRHFGLGSLALRSRFVGEENDRLLLPVAIRWKVFANDIA